ncbi:MAG: AAA family ATPase [Desulfobulbaceae bacterium]|nr:AAA family ATPase [Desulfobulbaceae bacterium]
MHVDRIKEKLRGIVEGVTYHNKDNGWSILRVKPHGLQGEIVKVVVHQVAVFAGATMEFIGAWSVHPKYGRQFKSETATELRPATAGALEKYLGSGLIKGVGPKTAKRIVKHFGKDTLEVFEHQMERLVEVPGIANKKLSTIQEAWIEHRAVRDVMMFLQSHGISTLFAVRIYKQYGDKAIEMVRENPYRLAADFYGIGFFSADKVALSIGFAPNSPLRIQAAIRHVLAAGRDQGHCYLTAIQVDKQVELLLGKEQLGDIATHLVEMERDNMLRVRHLAVEGPEEKVLACYYSKSLYYDEEYVGKRIATMTGGVRVDGARMGAWLKRYEQSTGTELSDEQTSAVLKIPSCRFSILTGGPGCGKTTTTKALTALLGAMGHRVALGAPTGRAAQRMGEVVGSEAKTIHRLLEYQGGGFKRGEDLPLEADYLIIDECSMLDISLTASLLKAVSGKCSVLFIGDPDQLPSVGAGNVLHDIINSGVVDCFALTKIFRQANESQIIRFAHEINRGVIPQIPSPFKSPSVWRESDCLFIDSDEATQEQLRFIKKVKLHFRTLEERETESGRSSLYEDVVEEKEYECSPHVPDRFDFVDMGVLRTADSAAEELIAVQKKVHPWSSLYYNLTAVDVVRELYCNWVPKYLGKDCEIQILSPMVRGSLGASKLNEMLQQHVNPARAGKGELQVGEKIFRRGDRVIHRRNNYDLGVYNGDIGVIEDVDNEELSLVVSFLPDYRQVNYKREDISELDIAYAITIHKSQGSEFDVVIVPVLTQHFRMLYRNLIYTGLTRAKKLTVFVGTRRALSMAVRNLDTSKRQSALLQLLQENSR